MAAASLSGESDADWARATLPHVGAAVLGGVSLDEPTRRASRRVVDRDREEFLPSDPFAWIDDQLEGLAEDPLRPAVNVRAASPEPVGRAAGVCADHDAILEINAHCRQPELNAAGTGERLLREPHRLATFVAAASQRSVDVSVKVRTEIDGVDLPVVARQVEAAGADVVHVDAMDSEHVVGEIVEATDCTVVANNEVRDRESVEEYLEYGADAVSVARPSTEPVVLERVRRATDAWFEARSATP